MVTLNSVEDVKMVKDYLSIPITPENVKLVMVTVINVDMEKVPVIVLHVKVLVSYLNKKDKNMENVLNVVPIVEVLVLLIA